MNKLVRKNLPFTQVPNTVLCDNKISLKAKGLYAYLFSKPTDWLFFREIIEKETKESYDAFRTGINELVAAGYIRKYQKNENGKFSGSVFEFIPIWEKPLTENPLTENPPTTNTDYVSSSYEDKTTNTDVNKNPYSPLKGTSDSLNQCESEKEKITTNQNKDNFFQGSASGNEQQTNDGVWTNTEFVESKFEEMWDEYKPYVAQDGRSVNKGAKKVAKAKFIKAVENGADPEQIILGTKNYIADCRVHKCLTKNVVTFLNQEQWQDFLDVTNKTNTRNLF